MKVLVVIDCQWDFIYGTLGSPEAQAIVPNVAAKVRQYAEMEDAVILYTQDTHFDNYMETMEGHYLPVPHCIHGTEGWRVVPEVFVEDATFVEKYTFGKYNLADEIWSACGLKYGDFSVETIELVGVCTSICVISNALILKSVFTDIPLIVDSKCCACVGKESHEAALTVMKMCQIEVI